MAEEPRKNVNVIFVGMAGSGKTTLLSALSEKLPSYLINLDPACNEPPYSADIDIRDTVNYKEVMKEYKLGPNGAIVTSLNLYSTKIDQLLAVLKDKTEPVLIDTPGQIEVFTWSASGQVIGEGLAFQGPTIYVYVVDTARCVNNPTTFMANMTYACSILYKSRLPLIVVFTKTDVSPATKLEEWMEDYDKYTEALETHQSYSNELQRSLCYALEEFYKNILHCCVSSKTGSGFEELIKKIEEAKGMYYTDYYEPLMKKVEKAKEEEKKKKEKNFEKFEKDKKEENDIDGDFCGCGGIDMCGEKDEGIVFRNGERFCFGQHPEDQSDEEEGEVIDLDEKKDNVDQ
ncbi:Gro-1 operon protein, putative [Entamoeba invadens IP1]|uniref:GPN-loop GTPase n=1 Tax=Entamoeba invadens IP1 TaxID=370355 RepID=L7FLH5_ENTIV|nr:Gro-1 operon protein, putative [Entamoeba invadens IP1]ELP88567.1 Gro-1 operon protein, putative [Entamoeba invadens IP1]|eukprot:XP_004255338.1 Gro-1 operon protein, putative [Entamoeba invadens IP1]